MMSIETPEQADGQPISPGDKTDIFRQDHHYAGLFWTPVDVAGAQRDQQEELARSSKKRFGRELVFLTIYLPLCLLPLLLAAWKPAAGALGGFIQPGMLAASISSVIILLTAFVLYRRTLALEFQRALLERMVATDPLTRLGNRRSMWEALERELERALLQDNRLTLVLIDLDRFKRVNDIHGHAIGDQVLKCFAASLRNHSRPGMDFGFRIGGDEFVMIIGADVEEARLITAQIRASFVADASKITRGILLDCSMGFTGHQRGETLEQWVHRADLAMLRAKTGGGGILSEEPQPLVNEKP